MSTEDPTAAVPDLETWDCWIQPFSSIPANMVSACGFAPPKANLGSLGKKSAFLAVPSRLVLPQQQVKAGEARNTSDFAAVR